MAAPSFISLVKGAAADLAAAAAGAVRIFVDIATGEPSYKDESGTVTSLKGADGSTGSTERTALTVVLSTTATPARPSRRRLGGRRPAPRPQRCDGDAHDVGLAGVRHARHLSACCSSRTA
jgi:hypothetical protein